MPRRRELIVERIQNAGTREIEMGRCGEIADHRTDPVAAHLSHHGFEDGAGIDVEQDASGRKAIRFASGSFSG